MDMFIPGFVWKKHVNAKAVKHNFDHWLLKCVIRLKINYAICIYIDSFVLEII